MKMWLCILGGALILTLADLVYLISRIEKFHFVQRLSGNRKQHRILISCAVLLAGCAVLWFFLGLVNLCVILIHLGLIWLATELILRLCGKYSGKEIGSRCYLAGVLAVLFTFLYLTAGYIIDSRVVITEYTVTTGKAVEPLKIVMISDAHIGSTFDGKGLAEHVKTINGLSPDAVLIAGDYVDSGSSLEDIKDANLALKSLQSVYGTFYVFGNHDRSSCVGSSLAELLENSNVHILQDETVPLPGGYTLIGRRDSFTGSRASIYELVSQAEPGSFLIDLNHQPNDYRNEEEAGVDLVLSGHTHGGQMHLIRIISELTGVNDSTYGYAKFGNTNTVVSSGISDWEMVFKTGCPSEIVVVNIIPEISGG